MKNTLRNAMATPQPKNPFSLFQRHKLYALSGTAAILLLPLFCLSSCDDNDSNNGEVTAAQIEAINADIKDDATAKEILTKAAISFVEKNADRQNNIIVGLLRTPENIKKAIETADPTQRMFLAVQSGCLPVCVYEHETNKVEISPEVLLSAAQTDNEAIVQYLVSQMPEMDEDGLGLLCTRVSQDVFAKALSRCRSGVDCSHLLENVLQSTGDAPTPKTMANIKYLLENYPMNDTSSSLHGMLINNETPQKNELQSLCKKAIQRTSELPDAENPSTEIPADDEAFIATYVRDAEAFLRRYPEQRFSDVFSTGLTIRTEENVRNFLTDNRVGLLLSPAAQIGSLPCCIYLLEKKGVTPKMSVLNNTLKFNHEKVISYLIDHGALDPKQPHTFLWEQELSVIHSDLLSGGHVEGVKTLTAKDYCTLDAGHSVDYLIDISAINPNNSGNLYYLSAQELMKRRMEIIRFLVTEKNAVLTPDMVKKYEQNPNAQAEFTELLHQLMK